MRERHPWVAPSVLTVGLATPGRPGKRRGGTARPNPCYPCRPTFHAVRNGRAAPLFFEMSKPYDKEKTLYREVAPRVERSVPGVEVLAVELTGPGRFTVFIDHPKGVAHSLCERVS